MTKDVLELPTGFLDALERYARWHVGQRGPEAPLDPYVLTIFLARWDLQQAFLIAQQEVPRIIQRQVAQRVAQRLLKSG